ncbi:hypothetical protein M422DRAFT_250259 [Sphaerobolus stellatus SS14]|uniref:Uncharacterized protein n=1 Tax=Sphaerobolus stellatus (strain SS14) TaxID=990650 RepID=A0A0C9VGQ8_SPHS4|nr:hypothetical protein M422DRAFT_250259 [Sphaerobolus stellatus SS14]
MPGSFLYHGTNISPCTHRMEEKPFRVFIRGVGSKDVTLWDTVGKIYAQLRRLRLIPKAFDGAIEPILYYDACCASPLNHSMTMRQLGIGDLSVLQLRYRLPGGSNKGLWDIMGGRPPKGNGTNSVQQASSSSRITHFPSEHPERWLPASKDGQWLCRVCGNNKIYTTNYILLHEKRDNHQLKLDKYLVDLQDRQEAYRSRLELQGHAHGFLSSMVMRIPLNSHQSTTVGAAPMDIDSTSIDWEGEGMDHNHELLPTLEEQRLMAAEEELKKYMIDDGAFYWSSDDEEAEIDVEDSENESEPQIQPDGAPLAIGARRRRAKLKLGENKEWYPWPDKESCVIDVLRHIPRCAFSDSQHGALEWAFAALGVSNIPSARVAKDIDKALQASCGITSKRYEGGLGHIYYANDLSGIIAQEMANPIVRPHLRFYPEDSGKKLAEAIQGRRWLYEMDDECLTPMIRIGKQDYFVFEPTLVGGHQAVVPHRFFIRDGKFHMRVWALEEDKAANGWIVRKDRESELPASTLLVGWPDFVQTFANRHLTDPCNIIGVRNQWRKQAHGSRVLSFPVWLYCDDTSGNSSKKWNKHNSFLFTAAGLPRKHVQREYNIHFLSTSNIAPPLEMMDGIVQQFEECQKKGIWAWDCVEKCPVLVVPWVFALLGDNPMQSEMACHRGLMAKFFCRICWVQGHEKDEGEKEKSKRNGAGVPSYSQAGSESEGSVSELGDDGASETDIEVEGEPSQEGVLDESTGVTKLNGKKKKAESKEQMIKRVTRFMEKSRARTAVESQTHLQTIFKKGAEVYGKTKSENTATKTGMKDTYMLHFLEKIWAASKPARGSSSKVNAIATVLKTLPHNIFSPVWRMKGLDPNSDTPVEILHVILLGFVKYLWRDAIKRLSKDQKPILMARLSSVSVDGLGIPPLAGKTLVTYAGSLTGRDFRAIVQVAPFCLYGLIPEECLQTWIALSRLVPLVWQPEIEDVDEHLKKLQDAIDHFLNCTVNWTPRWFNKPKFHILLHLPDHIKRFGPASLFATEGFESFNAVIRSFSIHSNRQAPSRDIARGFARGNRLRHMLSGGFFLPKFDIIPGNQINQQNNIPPETGWRAIGVQPRLLTNLRNFAPEMFGMPIEVEDMKAGRCEKLSAEIDFDSTQSSQATAAWVAPEHGTGKIRTAEKAYLQNLDLCRLGS